MNRATGWYLTAALLIIAVALIFASLTWNTGAML